MYIFRVNCWKRQKYTEIPYHVQRYENINQWG